VGEYFGSSGFDLYWLLWWTLGVNDVYPFNLYCTDMGGMKGGDPG
jgi:hypothetical protein